MCVEFNLRTDHEALSKSISARVYNKTGQERWDEKIRLTTKAVVLDGSDSGKSVTLSRVVFPQRPFPNSRLSDVVTDKKTEHAEVKRIYERPTWNNGFAKGHCIVPMTSFNESAYWGPEMGASMEFSRPGEILFAAAIRIKPQVPHGENFSGFSLLTHVAGEQVWEFHHRLVVFLKSEDALLWLSGPYGSPRENFDWLLENRYVPHFNIVKARTMASGWKKRVEEHETKRQEEKRYEVFLKNEHIQG